MSLKHLSYGLVAGLALAGSAFAGQVADVAADDYADAQLIYQAKRDVAQEVSGLLSDETFRTLVAERLNATESAPLSEVLGLYREQRPTKSAAVDRIFAADLAVRDFKGTTAYTAGLMEVRLVTPAGHKTAVDFENILVAFEPMGDDTRWTEVEAFDRQGNIHRLDATVAPDVPVLVADINSREDLRSGMAMVNEALQAAGLQATAEQTLKNAMAARSNRVEKAIPCNGIETAKMTYIRVKDDKESWLSGKAEMYVLVNGIDPTVAEPEIRLVDMPYLDHEDTNYYPNQILIYWYNYRYLAVNANFYEHDDDTNWQEILTGVISQVKIVLGVFAPTYAFLADVANAIISVMPEHWFANKDDYVDTIYTIDTDDLTSTSTQRTYYGAGANVTLKLQPYCLN